MDLVYTDEFICYTLWYMFWITFMLWSEKHFELFSCFELLITYYSVSLSDIWAFFLPSIDRSILCGKIVCHWTHSEIVPIKAYDVQYTYLGGHICLSAYLRNETHTAGHDTTIMNSGTMCGVNKVNKNFTRFPYMCASECLCM